MIVGKMGGLAALAVLGAAIGGTAQAAPQQLLNKSVVVSLSVLTPARSSDGMAVTSTPRAVTLTFYVSSQGRVFSRANQSVSRLADSTNRAPGEASVRISGNSLIGVWPLPSGAAQLTVNFDASFSTCTARVIMGAEGGKPIVFKGMDGRTYTQTGPPQVSGVSCSMRAGNAFAN